MFNREIDHNWGDNDEVAIEVEKDRCPIVLFDCGMDDTSKPTKEEEYGIFPDLIHSRNRK